MDEAHTYLRMSPKSLAPCVYVNKHLSQRFGGVGVPSSK